MLQGASTALLTLVATTRHISSLAVFVMTTAQNISALAVFDRRPSVVARISRGGDTSASAVLKERRRATGKSRENGGGHATRGTGSGQHGGGCDMHVAPRELHTVQKVWLEYGSCRVSIS